MSSCVYDGGRLTRAPARYEELTNSFIITGRITNAGVVQLMCPPLKFNGLVASDFSNARYLQLAPCAHGPNRTSGQ